MRRGLLSKSLALIVFSCLTFGPINQFGIMSSQSRNITSTVFASTKTNLPTNTKDGAILQILDWSFASTKSKLADIANAGFKTIQVGPLQGTKSSISDNSKWWLLYQPTNQSVGNQLGSLDEFKELCAAAKGYGISVIVDVIMNHTANNGNNDQIDSTVQYPFNQYSWYHNQGQCSNWSDRRCVTQQGLGMPDLNTSNTDVQNAAIKYLNSLIDAGASGLRFDAAKHIETNVGADAGQSYASNYWQNVLGSLHNKNNLFIYGEVLQGGADNIGGYETLMSVTASSYGASVRDAVRSCDVTKAKMSDFSGVEPTKAVDFFETHDTYLNDGDCPSRSMNDWQRKMAWSIVASRGGATPMMFARFTSSRFGDASNDIWTSQEIAAANNFHNAMAGQTEYLRTQGNQVLIVDRGTAGTAIINLGGDTYLNSPTSLANGTYTNQGTTNTTLTVSNGTISGNIPGGTAVYLYKGTSALTASTSVKGGTYNSAQSVALTASSSNASIYYTTDGSTPTTSSAKYSSPISVSTNTTLKFFAVDGTNQSSVYTETYAINNVNAAVKVHFKNPSNWGAPNVYYDASGVNKGSAWPGTKMTSEGNGWYSYTIQGWSTAKVIFNDGTNQNPGANQPGADVTGEEWYDGSTWYVTSPIQVPVQVTASANVKGGTYNSAQSVALAASSSNASIYYTTDGSIPTTSSAKYNSAIPVNASTTLKFFAVDGTNKSSVYTETYTINKISNSIKVHFKKPGNWGEPSVYYYDASGTKRGPSWPGIRMTNEGNGWYSYTIQDWSTAKVIFTDGRNQTPGASQPGYDVTGEKWFSNNTWYSSNPS